MLQIIKLNLSYDFSILRTYAQEMEVITEELYRNILYREVITKLDIILIHIAQRKEKDVWKEGKSQLELVEKILNFLKE